MNEQKKFIDKNRQGISSWGSMAIVTGVLVSRKQVSWDNQCSAGFQCRNCGKLSNCQLPEAETERKDG